ncbi:MAG: sigma-54 dependent transcriptional regulator [Methyloprofundus sp.]|nr:sigma-54 dependent transcriptional regulator [Methyloprofundus sp.]MDT8426697.1 sigma-54 dependent transcriptional regulator [Methyloprofundus sp.]
MKDCLLIIEDEKLLGLELQRFFRKQAWEVEWVESLDDARQILLTQNIDPIVILSDMNLPDGNALDFLQEMRDKPIQCSEWLFLTGYGSISDSVRALRLGAFDFIEKPCDLNRLNLQIEGAARSAKAQRRLLQEAQSSHTKYSANSFLGSSDSNKALRSMLSRIAQVPFSSLVISGETGAGKGLLAKVLHYSGKRSTKPLVEINCAALPHDLLESELFGFEAGAFTNAKKRHRGLFEQAHQGTLFLDEIGELELGLQSKLLKAVEELKIRRLGSETEIEVDVQIIAATNRDLSQQVAEGKFREDLYHRLSVLSVNISPLRDRLEDMQELVPAFIAEFNAKSGKKVSANLSSETWEHLYAYHWPGNTRELRNVIERCVLLAEDQEFPLQWLQLSSKRQTGAESVLAANSQQLHIPLDGSLTLQDMEKYILQKVLELTDYNVTAAARMLGSTRETLRYRVQKYHLKCD